MFPFSDSRPRRLPFNLLPFRRLLLGAAVVCAGCAPEKPAAGGGRGGGRRTADRQAVEVTKITRRDLAESVNVVGSLAANETATIRPEMSGLIRKILFEEGQRVKKGDLLVKIDDSELRAQLAQNQARHDLAQLNLTRAENLRQTQSNTQADVDRARSEFAAAEADVALLRVRLERTEVKVPFDGYTSGRTISVGDYVNPAAVITTINDLSRLKIEFQVPERYLAKVRQGTVFTVKSSALVSAGEVQGEVYFVDAVIDRTTRSSQVKGYLNSPPPGLKAGMFAVVELVLDVRKDALTVPEGAIYSDPQGPQLVMVQDVKGENVAAFVPVKLGLRSKGLVEVSAVTGELSERQSIVAAGVGALPLYPGARLDPRPLREEFRVTE